MTIFVNVGSVYLQGCLVSLIPSYPLKFSLRLEHTAPPPACCTQSSSLGDTQSEWGNDGDREPLPRRSGLGGEGMRARDRDLPARAPGPSNLLCARQKAPRRSPNPRRAGASAASIPGAALRWCEPGRGPAPSAACERNSVPGLPGFVAGAGARQIYDSVLPGRKRPAPPPRLGLQSPGVRRREEPDPLRCQAPARLPH